jgi:hypothetical protein
MRALADSYRLLNRSVLTLTRLAAWFLILHLARRRESKAQSEGLAAKLRQAGVEAKTHATINREPGEPDDAQTKAVFEFLWGWCEKSGTK